MAANGDLVGIFTIVLITLSVVLIREIRYFAAFVEEYTYKRVLCVTHYLCMNIIQGNFKARTLKL